MSSIDVACEPVTSAHLSVPAVVDRVFIFGGPVIEVKIAADAREGSYPISDDIAIEYLQFARTVPNGRVNLFVHTEENLRGKTLRAVVKVFKKRLDDGREYCYLDLLPMPADTPLTHRLGILPAGSLPNIELAGWKIIETPGPVKAQIIFAPPETKFTQETPAQPLKKPAAVKLRPVSSAKPEAKDEQLARLMGQGWSIQQEDEKTVTLSRTKNGVVKTMTHYRPRKN